MPVATIAQMYLEMGESLEAIAVEVGLRTQRRRSFYTKSGIHKPLISDPVETLHARSLQDFAVISKQG